MKTKAKTKQACVAIPIQIKEDAIESLIISALEGGSNYWYRIENKYPLTKERLMDVKKIIRGKAHLVVSEYMQTGKEDESERLTRARLSSRGFHSWRKTTPITSQI